MTSIVGVALFAVGFLVCATAAPWASSVPRCARECPAAGSQKLFYAPEKTYTYLYTGRSEIHVKDVEGGVSQMEWTSLVDLTWLTPCDMAISFKNPTFGGATGTSENRFLARYPMVVAMVDGRVQHVCSHPDDDTWSINLKKGIASALQNTLPSNSSVNTGLNFTETDVAGKCPTLYKVDNQGEKIFVEKKKNHQFCQERFPSQDETPASWIKAPLPVLKSWSTCKQEITKGIYTFITCEDKNIIKPAIGSYKYIDAKQESKLQLQSESTSTPPALSTLSGTMVRRSLRFDHETLKKDPSKVPKLEQALRQVCDKTKDTAEKDAASLVDRTIDLMKHVPESAVEQMLQKIESGEICSEKQNIESLFLDLLAYVQEANVVKLMVKEIVSGHTTGGRAALYTAALYFTPRPSLQAIEAVKPLFEQTKRFPMASLAAASMVNTYCKHHPHCQQEAPVRQAAETLSHKIQEHCSSHGSLETQKICLALLKSLGNMGVMTSEVARTVINIIEKKEVKLVIRETAAQAFRNAKCERELTRQLFRIVLDPKVQTEVRINSYLVAVRCAKEADLRTVCEKISREESTQARGFILSHLLNLQESSAPHKENLRYILSGISVPSNFSADIRKYSRNIDLSYYSPSFGVGAGLESDVIYGTRSFIPRSVRLNLTSTFGATPVNFGEFGCRFEGLESIIENHFGPEGYFQKTSVGQIIRDAMNYAEERGAGILDHVLNNIREKRRINLSSVPDFIKQMYGLSESPEVRADFFARFSGQEVAYGSLTKGFFEGFRANGIIDKFFSAIEEALHEMAEVNFQTARALQMALDYSLPTIQGLPLRMKLNGTAVVGLKMESRLNSLESSSPSLLKVKPSLSGQVNGFIGFDSFIASCGVRSVNHIASNNGISLNIKGGARFEIELDIPEKMDIIDIRSENYLMKAVEGQGEARISPSGVRLSEVQHRNCFPSLEHQLGLKVCYDLRFPDIFRSQGLPLGQLLTVKVMGEKSEPSMKGWKLTGNVQNGSEMKEVKIQMEAAESSFPRTAEVHVTSFVDQGLKTISASVSSHTSGGYKVELKTKHEESEKLLEVDVYSGRSHSFSPETQVLEVKLSAKNNGHTTKVQILTKTQNSLKAFIDHHFEVQGDMAYMESTGLPYPRRLEKFYLQTAISDIKMVSSVEKESDEEWATVLKVGSRNAEKFSFMANHHIEGTWEEGMSIKTAVNTVMGSTQFKAAFDIYNTHEKRGTALQILSPQETSKIVELEAVMLRSGQSYSVKFQLDIPRHMRPLKFEIKLEGQGSGRYHIQTALRHGGQTLVEGDGTSTAEFGPIREQFEIDLRVVTLVSEPHRISFACIRERNKKELSFEVKDQEQPLIGLQWELSSEGERETKAHFTFLLPSLMVNKVDAIISHENIQVSFNSLVSPKNSPRRVKGFANIDFENKRAKADVLWNADQDPNEKLSIEGTVLGGQLLSPQFTVRGSWTFIGSTYHYKTEIHNSDATSWLFGKKDIKVEILNPSQKALELETNIDIQKQSSGAKLSLELQYKNPESKEFKVNSDVSVESLGRPFNFKLNSKTEFIWPEERHSAIVLEGKYEHLHNQREIFVKAEISRPSLNKPQQTSFTLSHQPSSYMAKWMIDVTSPAEGAHYDLQLSSEGGIQSLKIGFDLREVVALLKAAHQLIGVGSSPSETMGSAKYLIMYERTEPAYHKFLIQSPFTHMEGEAKYSPSEYRVTLHPERHRNDKRYELTVTSSLQPVPWGREVKYKGRILYPLLERERRAEFAYTHSEGKIRGTLDLDIFPRSEDKITGTLESTETARNSWRVEAKLSGNALKSNPRIVVSASYASHTVGFDLVFEKTASARPSLSVSAKYDRSFGRNAAVAFTVKTEASPLVDISGSVKPQQEPSCNGVGMSAVAQISTVGRYDVFSKLCKPGFAKVTMKREGSDKATVARLGLQAMKDLEFSISEKNERLQEEKYIAMTRVSLAAPTLVNIEFNWNSEKTSALMNAASEKWRRESSGIWSWTENMGREIVAVSGSDKPSAHMARLWREAKEECQRIYIDLVNYNIIPSWIDIPTIQGVIGGYRMLWSQVDAIKNKMNNVAIRTIQSLRSRSSSPIEAVDGVVIGTARWMKTGGIPEEIRHLAEKIKNSRLWNDIKTFFDHLGDMFGEQKETFIEVLKKYMDTLKEDLERIRCDIFSNNIRVQEIVDWIISDLRFEKLVIKGMDRVINKVVQSSLLSSTEIRGDHMEVQIPLRQPVSSLTQAWRYALVNPVPVPENVIRLFETLTLQPVENLLWSYYNFLPQCFSDLLPPYNSTAVLVDGSDILTFDGAVLQAPQSPCRVVLATYESMLLTMEYPGFSRVPQIHFASSGSQIFVTPDHKVMINGNEVTSPEASIGHIMVKRSPEEIKLTAQTMVVQIYPQNNVITAEASGWMFGRVAGLFGTYDGEMGNDRATAMATEASSFHELVHSSWQEDKKCPTPTVTPVSETPITPFRSLQCETLLGVRSRCNPVVRPEPFIKMCLASRNACDVARAYHSVCSNKGVKDVLPLTC
ncbi:vitellogenin-like [Macrobrachium rosenbergii]|uniref:vitellogenin-like n=1 Tax=Macrobrachium rosenbergii TaxID=79674 RepID=UPI0034D67C54